MTYRASRAPRLLVGSIGLAVLASFAAIVFGVFGPQVYRAYQLYHIEACEEQHGVWREENEKLFFFDAGGWKIVGNSPENLAFIDCIRGRLSVETDTIPDNSDPAIEIVTFSFSHVLRVTYFPAAP